jgi:hypothetical protein
MGYFSLGASQGSNNTAVGTNALVSIHSGDENTAIGYRTLLVHSDGSSNTSVGCQTMISDTSGAYNTAIGANALSTNVSGSKITCVGYEADAAGDDFTNASAFGNGAIVTASNSVVIGNSNVTSIGGYANWNVLSDGRFKSSVQENVPGLSFIKKLRPITYQLDQEKLELLTRPRSKRASVTSAPNQNGIVKTGLIAQEVESAALESSYEFDGVIRP